MKRMTHNEYNKFLKDNANKIYTDDDYSLTDFRRDTDSVKVTDYDLSSYSLSKDMKKIINTSFSSNGKNKNGNDIFFGRCEIDYVDDLAYSLNCLVECNLSYNGFYSNYKDKMILEFAEGDVTLVLCNSNEKYNQELRETVEFYNKNYEANIDMSELLFAPITNKKNVMNNNMETLFSFGTWDKFPYQGGFLIVNAQNRSDAIKEFRKHYPDINEGIINCSDIYTEPNIIKDFKENGNRGNGCHEYIDSLNNIRIIKSNELDIDSVEKFCNIHGAEAAFSILDSDQKNMFIEAQELILDSSGNFASEKVRDLYEMAVKDREKESNSIKTAPAMQTQPIKKSKPRR